MEHTPKNILIRAVRQGQGKNNKKGNPGDHGFPSCGAGACEAVKAYLESQDDDRLAVLVFKFSAEALLLHSLIQVGGIDLLFQKPEGGWGQEVFASASLVTTGIRLFLLISERSGAASLRKPRRRA